tara:strand:- start:180 stop:383 length:204 start_codon:yes stop_codon:yes gene_type:complete
MKQANFTRDESTGALLSTDVVGLRNHKKRRAQQLQKDSQILEMSNDINSLKDELSEIKLLLKSINQR